MVVDLSLDETRRPAMGTHRPSRPPPPLHTRARTKSYLHALQAVHTHCKPCACADWSSSHLHSLPSRACSVSLRQPSLPASSLPSCPPWPHPSATVGFGVAREKSWERRGLLERGRERTEKDKHIVGFWRGEVKEGECCC